MKKLTFVILLICLSSQKYIAQKIDLSSNNFYEIQKSFYSNSNPRSENKYLDDEWYKFHRWEYLMEPRVFPSGDLSQIHKGSIEAMKYIQKKNFLRNSGNNKWMSLEPQSSFSLGGNAGRVNALTFHPSDTNILYVGTPAGGLWKSIDSGLHWESLTDQIPSIGVSEIVVNPTNTKEIFIATGDRDAAYFISNPYSYGILKTLDGGKNWDTTGLNFNAANKMSITRLVMHPNNSRILFATTSSSESNFKGLWKSVDGGDHWQNINGGAKYDIEFHPTNPDIIYISGYKNIQRSIDGGLTWNIITSIDLPLSSDITSSRLAVSNAEPDAVFVEYLKSDGNTYGLYKSSDRGITWRNVNKMSISTQGNYDFDFAVSPIDTGLIILGGQFMFVSTNGGKTMVTKNAGHLDHHGFYFRPNSKTFYDCNDGGLYVTYNLGNTWTNLNSGLGIMQYYRLGSSQTDSTFILGGAQDNGSLMLLNGKRQMIFGADGMECVIDPKDNDVYYTTYQYGNIVSWGTHSSEFTQNPLAGSTSYSWVAPFLVHPDKPENLFVAGKDIYKSDNYGFDWKNYSQDLTVADAVGGGSIRAMAIAPSDPDNYLYAVSYVVVYRTKDGGKSWEIITSNLPTSAGCLDCSALSSILIDPKDAEHVWVTMSGYSIKNKVYETKDGGKNWTNISGSLPAVPMNTIAIDEKHDRKLYVGTDIGVFRQNQQKDDWELFMNGLPYVPIQKLEMLPQFNVLRAATFGRGLWQVNVDDVVTKAKDIKESHDDISIFPDPNLKLITVLMEKIEKDTYLELISTEGKSLNVFPIISNAQQIRIPQYSASVLYYKLYNQQKILKSGSFPLR